MTHEFCKIVLDHDDNLYFPGQILAGTVEIAVQEPKKIKGIIVRYRGAAETCWSESTYDSDSAGNSRDVTYKDEEVYFDTQYYCTGGKSHEAFLLASGLHVYSFSYPLPLNLPSTFKGQAGNIGYFVEVILDRPWRKNLGTKQEFTITSALDLNLFPRLRAPGQTVLEHFFCCWCCKGAPLTAIVSISKSGYVCGEEIHVGIDLDNASSVDLRKISLKFHQSTIFKGKHLTTKPKETSQVYQEMELEPIKAHSSKNWRRDFSIPDLPPTSPFECGIIRPRYEICLEIQPEGLHNDVNASLPVTIGTSDFIGAECASPPDYTSAMGFQNVLR